MRIIRFAMSCAMSCSGIGTPLLPVVVSVCFGPNAVPSLRNDSMMRNAVGNQIGPRQFELPPFSLLDDSAGS